MKKKLLLILASTFVSGSFVMAAAEAPAEAEKAEYEAPKPWNDGYKKEREASRLELSRRPSFKGLEEMRKKAGFKKYHQEKFPGQAPSDGEHTYMNDIQKPGDASKAMGRHYSELMSSGADNIKKGYNDELDRHKTLARRDSFRALQDVRKERKDDLRFDRGSDKNLHVRMDDITEAGQSSRLMAEELKQADKYIAHLQNKNRELREKLRQCEEGTGTAAKEENKRSIDGLSDPLAEEKNTTTGR